jgi:hypothetical protein
VSAESALSPGAMAEAKTSFALKPYLDCIKATLHASLCVENFASQIVERHNKPEVEVGCAAGRPMLSLVSGASHPWGCVGRVRARSQH